jgi:uncharacterized delta-60 repeat protein
MSSMTNIHPWLLGRRNVSTAIVLSMILFPAHVRADTGDLDLTFNGDGKVLIDFPSSFGYAYDLAIQSDGRITAAGTVLSEEGGYDVVLVRLMPDGTPDPEFGVAGLAVTDFGEDEGAYSLAIQADGKIVVGGTNNRDFMVARFNSDGSPDTHFGTNGRVRTDFNGWQDSISRIALQSDGGIVAVGFTQTAADLDFGIVRYDTDGILDTGFGDQGKVTTDFNGLFDAAQDVVILPNGRILVVGRAMNPATPSISDDDHLDFGLARYNLDGSPDSDFGGDGRVTTDIGYHSADQAMGVVVLPDGKIVVGGTSYLGGLTGWDFALACYNHDGTLDSGFGTSGLSTTHLVSNAESAMGLARQADGRFILVGLTSNTGPSDFLVARYDRDGYLDRSFGGEGWVTTSLEERWDYANRVALQPDGKIVAIGISSIDGTFAWPDFAPAGIALTRYEWLNEPQCEILRLFERVNELIDDGLLSSRRATSLLFELGGAVRALENDWERAAALWLAVFTIDVRFAAGLGYLPAEEGQTLIETARVLINYLWE